MAKLTSFMLGEATQNTFRPDGKSAVQNLIGLTLAIRPQYIPSSFSFAVSFGISDIDLTKENTVQIVLVDPSGEIVQDLGKTLLPVINEEDSMPMANRGFVCGVDFRNAIFKVEGCYKLKIYLNDELIESPEIPVYQTNLKV